MDTLKFLSDRPIRIGGQQKTGWLPVGAAIPLRTPTRDLLFNLDIQFAGIGYLLCYASPDGSVYSDTWHETLADAEEAARSSFGIVSTEWKSN